MLVKNSFDFPARFMAQPTRSVLIPDQCMTAQAHLVLLRKGQQAVGLGKVPLLFMGAQIVEFERHIRGQQTRLGAIEIAIVWIVKNLTASRGAK